MSAKVQFDRVPEMVGAVIEVTDMGPEVNTPEVLREDIFTVIRQLVSVFSGTSAGERSSTISHVHEIIVFPSWGLFTELELIRLLEIGVTFQLTFIR